MKRISLFCVFFSIILILPSCEFRCSVGEKDKGPEGNVVVKDGARIYNNIELQPNGVKVEKAYLLFEDGKPVPETNVIDFNQPVQLRLFISDGWQEDSNKVFLGASEKISTEQGEVLLDEPDLFAKYPDGISPGDAKLITVTAKIIIRKKLEPLTIFNVQFRVWDKKNGNSVEGSYKLYSK